jgi:hypothetical protein
LNFLGIYVSGEFPVRTRLIVPQKNPAALDKSANMRQAFSYLPHFCRMTQNIAEVLQKIAQHR